jgi:hypothetical protein
MEDNIETMAPKRNEEYCNGTSSPFFGLKKISLDTLSQKSVHWSPKMQSVKKVTHKKDMSVEEINQTWYNLNELPELALLVDDLSDLSYRDMIINSFCVRGGDKQPCCRQCIFRSLCRRQRAWQVVVEESAEQRKSGVESDELLSELYQEVNQGCTIDARRRAMLDEYKAWFDSEIVEENDSVDHCSCNSSCTSSIRRELSVSATDDVSLDNTTIDSEFMCYDIEVEI